MQAGLGTAVSQQGDVYAISRKVTESVLTFQHFTPPFLQIFVPSIKFSYCPAHGHVVYPEKLYD